MYLYICIAELKAVVPRFLVFLRFACLLNTLGLEFVGTQRVWVEIGTSCWKFSFKTSTIGSFITLKSIMLSFVTFLSLIVCENDVQEFKSDRNQSILIHCFHFKSKSAKINPTYPSLELSLPPSSLCFLSECKLCKFLPFFSRT